MISTISGSYGDDGGGGLIIPITPIECIFKYIWYYQNNIYREAMLHQPAKIWQRWSNDVALISNNKIVGTSIDGNHWRFFYAFNNYGGYHEEETNRSRTIYS